MPTTGPEDRPDALDGLDRETQVLCLGARSTPSPAAAARSHAIVAAGIDWERLWALGHLHEVIPLLARSLPASAGELVPDDWRQQAIKRRHVTLRSNGTLAAALLPILDGMALAGIPAMPVKGLVIADRLYGDLAARPCADLDVLVRPADYAAAGTILYELGFRQRAEPRYKALVHEFHGPAWDRGTGPDHVRLELHWALWADSERRMGTDGMWERSVANTLLGRPIRTLSTEDTLLHLAIHRTRSALRLRWVTDVAELVRAEGATLDWDAYLERARIARGRTASSVVLSLARDLLDAPVPPGVMDALAVGWPKRSILERTCGRTAMFRATADGDLTQQPHLSLRAFEEDGVRRIVGSVSGSAVRPIREALHDAGIVRVHRRMA